jgi:hypothetical protein
VTESEFLLLKEALGIKGQIELEIISGSMLPLIAVGQCVQVVPVDFRRSELRQFDIIVFFQNQNSRNTI